MSSRFEEALSGEVLRGAVESAPASLLEGATVSLGASDADRAFLLSVLGEEDWAPIVIIEDPTQALALATQLRREGLDVRIDAVDR